LRRILVHWILVATSLRGAHCHAVPLLLLLLLMLLLHSLLTV